MVPSAACTPLARSLLPALSFCGGPQTARFSALTTYGFSVATSIASVRCSSPPRLTLSSRAAPIARAERHGTPLRRLSGERRGAIDRVPPASPPRGAIGGRRLVGAGRSVSRAARRQKFTMLWAALDAQVGSAVVSSTAATTFYSSYQPLQVTRLLELTPAIESSVALVPHGARNAR
jgi:hypothetical protein